MQNPILLRRFAADFVAEPYFAKFYFAARIFQSPGVRRRFNRDWLVEQFENPLAGGHRRLQNVEFLAQVLNRPEEALRPQRVRSENAQRYPARQDSESAGPIDKCNR